MENLAIWSTNRCRLKSASFRNNEQFLRTFTKLIHRASAWCDYFPDSRVSKLVNSGFASAFARLRDIDKSFLRVESNAMLRDYIPRFIEGRLIPALTDWLRTVRRYKFLLGWYRSLSLERDREARSTLLGEGSEIQLDFDTLSALFEAGQKLAYRIIVSVAVLSIVYRYLLGHVDRGRTKTYNPGSIEFRDIYVSLLLFRGAYVWIKFRDVDQRGVKRVPKRDGSNRVLKDASGQTEYYDKYEARFKPPKERQYLYLGVYDTEEHAVVVRQIGMSFYWKDVKGEVALEDGSPFSIPVMNEQERSLCGEEKRKWVSAKAKAVFTEIQEKNKESRENASRRPPNGNQVDARGCSSSADPSAIALLAPASADGNDVFPEAPLTITEQHGALVSGDEGNFEGLTFNEDFFNDAPTITQEKLNEQLHLQKRQIEAECDRRLAEEHQKYRRLEEEISELRQESKRLKTMLQQAANPLRTFFVTSTVELECSTDNC